MTTVDLDLQCRAGPLFTSSSVCLTLLSFDEPTRAWSEVLASFRARHEKRGATGGANKQSETRSQKGRKRGVWKVTKIKGTRPQDVDGLKYRPPMGMSSRMLWSMRGRGDYVVQNGDERWRAKTEREGWQL